MSEGGPAQESNKHTCDSCNVPFSRICLITSSSTDVPNSLSRMPFEAPS